MAQTNKVAAKRPGFFARLGGYFRNVRTELRRVIWPSRSEVLSSSIIVIVTLLFFMAFTFLIDSAASYLFLTLLPKLGGAGL